MSAAAPCFHNGAALTLAEVRARDGANASSGTSAADLFYFAPAAGYSEPLRSHLQVLEALQQEPGAFRLAPHLPTGCNHSVFHVASVAIQDETPALNEGRSARNPLVRSIGKYCIIRRHRLWPPCPPTRAQPLRLSQIFFAVLTTSRLVRARGSIMARVLRRQNASFGIFSDTDAPDVRGLPVSGYLERLVHNRSIPQSLRQTRGLSFIAQKHLELLHTLARDSALRPRRERRWWVILDDDSFVFVDRLLQTLQLVDDAQPLLVGGAFARSHLCANNLCDYREYVRRHGFAPVIHALAGGTSYALSDSGLRRIGRAIRDNHCLDATLGDLATAACARIAGVRIAKLSGGWMVNDGSIAGQWANREKANGNRSPDSVVLRHQVIEQAAFTGQLISVHKLPDKQALCWAEHGECSERCDCACQCAATGSGGRTLRGCREPAGSACDFECPADTWTDSLQPPAGGRRDVDGNSVLAADGVQICTSAQPVVAAAARSPRGRTASVHAHPPARFAEGLAGIWASVSNRTRVALAATSRTRG